MLSTYATAPPRTTQRLASILPCRGGCDTRGPHAASPAPNPTSAATFLWRASGLGTRACRGGCVGPHSGRAGSGAVLLAGMDTPKPRLRWFQFSLRSLLVFVTLCALPCSWLAMKKYQVDRQREAMTAIRKPGRGASVLWESVPRRPTWLSRLLGDDFYGHVAGVDLTFFCFDVGDDDLAILEGLDQLRSPRLTATKLHGTGLKHIAGLSQLRELILIQTRVTDAGLENLRNLNNLKSWI